MITTAMARRTMAGATPGIFLVIAIVLAAGIGVAALVSQPSSGTRTTSSPTGPTRRPVPGVS